MIANGRERFGGPFCDAAERRHPLGMWERYARAAYQMAPPPRDIFATRQQCGSSNKKLKIGLACFALAGHAAMGQLLVMLTVPPIVGVVTYVIIRRLWERDENAGEAVGRRDPSPATPAEGTSPDR